MWTISLRHKMRTNKTVHIALRFLNGYVQSVWIVLNCFNGTNIFNYFLDLIHIRVRGDRIKPRFTFISKMRSIIEKKNNFRQQTDVNPCVCNVKDESESCTWCYTLIFHDISAEKTASSVTEITLDLLSFLQIRL